jgi:hypothetical protein
VDFDLHISSQREDKSAHLFRHIALREQVHAAVKGAQKEPISGL